MVRIPEETINHIRSQTNIKEVIERYVDLNKSGQNYFAHCPFHEDRTPSFSVNENKQIFKCFSCGRGGNVYTFVQEIEKLTFVESVFKVADISQIHVDQSLKNAVMEQGPAADTPYGKLLKIHEKAKDLYQHILLHAEVGEEAYDYLQSRGISREVMEEFELGFSPRQRESLSLYLKTQKDLDIDEELLSQSGIFSEKKPDDDQYKDRFFNRIIFPLNNHNGKTVGFSGRIFQTDDQSGFQTAKYLNSPETQLFNKRKLLFNFDKAKRDIRKSKEAVLFEGYMDVIAGWKAGVHNSIASMGTSLTSEHIQAISSIADTLVIAFDGDNAGIESAKKIAELLQSQSQLNVEIVKFPDNLDPDDYAKEYGDESLYNIINRGRQTLFQFLKDYYKKHYNLNNEAERLKYIELMIQEVSKLSSAVERDIEAKELAEEYDVSIETIMNQVQTNLTQTNHQHVQKLQRDQKSREESPDRTNRKKRNKIDVTQERLLNRLFYYPEVADVLERYTDNFEFATHTYERIYLFYEQFKQTDHEIDDFLNFVEEPELKQVISDIMWITIEVEPTDEEILDYAHYIQEIYPLEQKRHSLNEQLSESKRQGNTRRELELTTELIKLNRKLKG